MYKCKLKENGKISKMFTIIYETAFSIYFVHSVQFNPTIAMKYAEYVSDCFNI